MATATKAPVKKAPVKKAPAPKPVQDAPKRNRRTWTAKEHAELMLTWAITGMSLPTKSMVHHVSKAFALDPGVALKVAVEYELKLKELVKDNAETFLREIVELHNGEFDANEAE